MGNEEKPPVPASQTGAWTSFLKSITSYNGDLSSLTAPPFILSPTSLTEYSKFWGEQPRELVAAAAPEISDFHTNTNANTNNISNQMETLKNEIEENITNNLPNINNLNINNQKAEKRFLSVVKWFIGTLRSQYASRSEKLGSEKKPLNPFLGELFLGKWSTNDEGDTILVSEQVSHHPPVTAYALMNDKNGVLLQGFNGVKTAISATSLTISVKQVGHALLTISPPKKEHKDKNKDKEEDINNENEYYLITLPALHIEGLLFGSPFVELEKDSYIVSSSGYRASIEYSGRGYFSGKKNTFKAKIYEPITSENKVKTNSKSKKKDEGLIYTISGQWSGTSKIVDARTKVEKVFWDAKMHDAIELEVKPIEKQGEKESRRAWKDVAEAVRIADYDAIHTTKSALENEERQKRKKEAEQGHVWKSEFFISDKENDSNFENVYQNLCSVIDVTPDSPCWRFSRDLFTNSKYTP